MRRILPALAVGVTLFATVAFAASLGPITTGTLGAGSEVVSSCDDDGVTVEWGTHMSDHTDATHPLGGFFVDTVTVKSIDALCEGKYVLMDLDKNGGHWQFCISDAIPASGEVTLKGVSSGQPYNPPLVHCLNANRRVYADELTEVHIIIKDTPY